MKQKLITSLLTFAIAAVAAPVSAQDASVEIDASVNSKPVQVETRMKVNTDLRSIYDAKQADLRAQREKLRAEAEVRKAQAETRGDAVQAKRETLRIQLEEKRADADARREAHRLEMEEKRAATRAKVAEIKQDVAEKKAATTARAISVMIERLENIISRIESRIEKIKARGGDTSESESYVAQARVNLSDAQVAANAFASVDLSGETIREDFERIRALATEVREHLRAAHQNLMLAVRALSSVELDLEADSSAEVEVETE